VDTPYYFKYEHQYIDRCYLLNPFVKPMIVLLSFVYLVYSVLWIVYPFCVWKRTNYNLQRWLASIPILKALWCMQLSLEYFTCPWDSDNTLVYVSIFVEQILSILTVICSSTIINSLFYLISLGWHTTLQHIDRNSITNVMIVGGSLYLLQLAKNYSNYDENIFPVVFDFALVIEYAVLLWINIKNLNNQIAKISQVLAEGEDLAPAAFNRGLKMKYNQLRNFKIVIILFYTTRILYCTYIGCAAAVGSDNEYLQVCLGLLCEYIDAANFQLLLFTFRPRKQWPDFYAIGIDHLFNRRERQNNNEEAARARAMV
jgi:hypothetical protein